MTNPITILVDYLQLAYSRGEFEQFLSFKVDYGLEIVTKMQEGDESLDAFSAAFVLALWRRARLNDELWQALRHAREYRIDEINAVAASSGREQLDALDSLLVDSFSLSELRQFISLRLGQELFDALVKEAPFTNAVRALRARGLLNQAFFDALAKSRPERSEPRLLAEYWQLQREDLKSVRDEIERLRDKTPPGPAHERITNALAIFNDPVEFRTRLGEREARVVRVDRNTTGCGTGWLVGPDLVLTARHVLPSGGALDGVSILLDHKRVRTDQGVLETSGRRVALAPNALLAEGGVETKRNELSRAGPDGANLDFALLRLAERVGDDETEFGKRGWFRLLSSGHSFDPMEGLYVLGHPDLGAGQAGPLKLTIGIPSDATVTTSGTRVRYTTNTKGGSSGSPVMNQSFAPVAMHNIGTSAQPSWDDAKRWRKGFNQGIPISRIIAALREQLQPELRAELRI